MAAGAIDAVRGSRSSTEELYHIITHSDRYGLLTPLDSTPQNLTADPFGSMI